MRVEGHPTPAGSINPGEIGKQVLMQDAENQRASSKKHPSPLRQKFGGLGEKTKGKNRR